MKGVGIRSGISIKVLLLPLTLLNSVDQEDLWHLGYKFVEEILWCYHSSSLPATGRNEGYTRFAIRLN